MNLAIEYLLRSGELKHKLEFPYSVFVNRYDNNDKMVVTIYESFHRDRLCVKHWRLGKCDSKMSVPPFDEYEIERDAMFASEKTVVPGHFPLWYREEPFRAGKTQHPDPPLAYEDEKEYQERLDNFLNTKRHREARVEWLWRAFLATYKVELKGFVSVRKDSQLAVLKQHAPSLVSHWVRWRRYMLDFSTKLGQVAGELLFHKEYADIAKKEGRELADTVAMEPELTVPRMTINLNGTNPYQSYFNFGTTWSTTVTATSGISTYDLSGSGLGFYRIQ